MSKEKQIEEMTELICDNYANGKCATDGFVCNRNCEYKDRAERLYTAGYRKQIEGEWEKRVFIIFDSEKTGYRCSECNTTWDTQTPCCPNCGAKMKG